MRVVSDGGFRDLVTPSFSCDTWDYSFTILLTVCVGKIDLALFESVC